MATTFGSQQHPLHSISRDRNSRDGLIDDIQILRAMAILLVLFQHMSILLWTDPVYLEIRRFVSGETGVDLFFVISGFVISRTLLPQLVSPVDSDPWVEIRNFWLKRFWRIAPSAWIWILIPILLATFCNDYGLFGAPYLAVRDGAAAFFHLANFHFYECHAADKIGSGCYWVLGPYWSLSLEEQFYFALPVAALFWRRDLLFFIGAVVLVQLFIPREPFSLLWELRSDGLCLGVVIAIFSTSKGYIDFLPSFLENRIFSSLVITTLILSLMIFTVRYSGVSIVPFGVGVVAIISSLLVWIASYNRDYLIRSPILKSPMMWIGNRSFALYLAHVPIFAFCREVWHRLFNQEIDGHFLWKFDVSALLALAIVADINYRIIEIPLRRYGHSLLKIDSSDGSEISKLGD